MCSKKRKRERYLVWGYDGEEKGGIGRRLERKFTKGVAETRGKKSKAVPYTYLYIRIKLHTPH